MGARAEDSETIEMIEKHSKDKTFHKGGVSKLFVKPDGCEGRGQ